MTVSAMKCLFIAALLAGTNAQICCNLDQECKQYDKICDESTSCYTDPRFAHICEDDDGSNPPGGGDWEEEIEKLKEEIEILHETDARMEAKATTAIKQLRTDLNSAVEKLAGLSTWKSHGNFLYKCFTGLKSYEASQSECAKYGGTIATKILRDPVIAADLVSSDCKTIAFIGYKKVGNHWEWLDGGETNPETTEWAPNRPDNIGGTENCGEIEKGQDGKILMNDVTCFWTRKYICEIEL